MMCPNKSDLGKKKIWISKLGLSFGMALALAAAMTAGLGSWIVWKFIDEKNQYDFQSLVESTNRMVAYHFKAQLNRWMGSIAKVGEQQIRIATQKSSQLAGSPSQQNLPLSQVNPIEAESEILDVSLWIRGESTGVYDLSPDPKVIFIGVNTQLKSYYPEYARNILTYGIYEKELFQTAFKGKTLFTLTTQIPNFNATATFIIPFSESSYDFVLVSHISLVGFQNIFQQGQMIPGMLIDRYGNILAHSESKWMGKREGVKDSPLFLSMLSSKSDRGQLYYQDASKTPFFGNFIKIPTGQVAVLSSLSENEAGALFFPVTKKYSLIFVISIFLVFLGSGYWVMNRASIIDLLVSLLEKAQIIFYQSKNLYNKSNLPGLSRSPKQQSLHQSLNDSFDDHAVHIESPSPKETELTVIYGSFVGVSRLIKNESPEAAMEFLNENIQLVSTKIIELGGVFEKQSATSFIGIWGVHGLDGTEAWCALKCSLELRQGFAYLNELRKIENRQSVILNLGVHTGKGLVGVISTNSIAQYSLVGEVLSFAKLLNQLTEKVQVDILISQGTWKLSEGKFQGELKGKAKFKKESGSVSYYTLTGYLDEQGRLIKVDIPKYISYPDEEQAEILNQRDQDSLQIQESNLDQKKPSRWLVNNGSQMIGPLNAEEISMSLFMQELDFDSECWEEGTGLASQIKDAKIFSNSNELSGTLWLYDGKMIHGPMSLGFLKTAVMHGAIQEATYVCEKSTIQGWKKFKEWWENIIEQENHQNIPSQSHEQSNSKLSDNVINSPDMILSDSLRESLAPPNYENLVTKEILTPAPTGEARSKKAA